MSSIIIYSSALADRMMPEVMAPIEKRYTQLKNTMFNNTFINIQRTRQLTNIRNFLTQANSLYSQYNLSELEKILRNHTETSLNEKLHTAVQNSSQLLESKYNPNTYNQSYKELIKALEELYSLYSGPQKKGNITVNQEQFSGLIKKISSSILKNSNSGMKEIGNILGDMGAISAAYKTQDILQELLGPIQEWNSPNMQIKIYDTGTKKINKQTITTDTLTVLTDGNGNIRANLRISDKLNTVYKKKNKINSTGTIKLATRTVENFIKEAPVNLKSNYEFALLNYISYHGGYGADHFDRQDFTKTQTDNWVKLRKTIGGEMLYNEMTNTKGKFDFQGTQINDEIDLYIYGDKIFLASDIIKTKQQQSSSEFNAVAINIANKRKQILTNPNKINSRPTPQVLAGGEETVYQIIKTTSMSYSQSVRFFDN